METKLYATFDKDTKAFTMIQSMPQIKDVPLEGHESDQDSQECDTNKQSTADGIPGKSAENTEDGQLSRELARAQMSAKPVFASSSPTKELSEQTLSVDTLLTEQVSDTTNKEDDLPDIRDGETTKESQGEPNEPSAWRDRYFR